MSTVREITPVEGPQWWELPIVQDGVRWLLGAIVVLALLFGVLRPALRGLGAPRTAPAQLRQDPMTADVQLVDDDLDLAALGDDSVRTAQGATLALPVDSYEERLRLAREAVKTDSKRVAQVVKGWVAND